MMSWTVLLKKTKTASFRTKRNKIFFVHDGGDLLVAFFRSRASEAPTQVNVEFTDLSA